MWVFICILAPVPAEVKEEYDLNQNFYNFNHILLNTNLFYSVVFTYISHDVITWFMNL